MNLYLVTFDLDGASGRKKVYKDVDSAFSIDKKIIWFNDRIKQCRFVASDQKPSYIRTIVKSHLRRGDNIFIAKLSGPWAISNKDPMKRSSVRKMFEAIKKGTSKAKATKMKKAAVAKEPKA